MLTRTKLFSASLALALLAVVGATCLAQQPQNQTQNQSPGAGGPPQFGRGGPGRRGHGPGEPGGPGMLGPGALRELNLTDDQKQQIQKIREANFEELRKERKANHDGFGRRGGFRKEQGKRNQSTPPPANPPVEP